MYCTVLVGQWARVIFLLRHQRAKFVKASVPSNYTPHTVQALKAATACEVPTIRLRSNVRLSRLQNSIFKKIMFLKKL